MESGEDFTPVLEKYLARIHGTDSPVDRARLLRELSRLCEDEMHDPARALTASLAAYREQPQRAAWSNLERLAGIADGWSELVSALEEAAPELAPEDQSDAWVHVGNIYEQRLGHPDQAMRCYRSGAASDGRCPEARRRLEALLRARGEYAELVRLLDERAVSAPELERRGIAYELADLYAQLGNRKEAIARYEELRREEPCDLLVLRALEALYRLDQRVHELLDVLEAQAGVVQGSRNLADLYQRMAIEWEQQLGSNAKAEECLEWVLHYDPAREQAFRALERLYRSDGNWHAAVDVYSRHAAKVKPARRAELHAEVARICERELKDAAGAIEFYRKIEVDRPGTIDAMSGPIRLFERTENFDQMVSVLERRAAKAEGPAQADLYHRAGELTLKQLADPPRATELFVRALEANPAHLPSMIALAESYRDQGKLLHAARLLREATQATANRSRRRSRGAHGAERGLGRR